jgi:hypothetical protein
MPVNLDIEDRMHLAVIRILRLNELTLNAGLPNLGTIDNRSPRPIRSSFTLGNCKPHIKVHDRIRQLVCVAIAASGHEQFIGESVSLIQATHVALVLETHTPRIWNARRR